MSGHGGTDCGRYAMAFRLVTLFALCFFILGSDGCHVNCRVASVSSGEKETGNAVSQEILDEIQLGQTTDTWLIAKLGRPSSRSTTDGGGEILRYRHQISYREYLAEPSEDGTITLKYPGERHVETKTVCFEVVGGKIRRYWKEDG